MKIKSTNTVRRSFRSAPSLVALMSILAIALVGPWGCDKPDVPELGSFGDCCDEDADCQTDACAPGHWACSYECIRDTDCPPEPKTGVPSCKNGLCQAEKPGDICAAAYEASMSSGGTSEVICTFPNDISICGCGNACLTSSGTCQTCGIYGDGCPTDDIYCCADIDCPSGTHCSSLSTNPKVGYHICLALEPCSTTSDCTVAEVCQSGYCRDAN